MASSSQTTLWPRQEIFNLILPVYSTNGRPLTYELVSVLCQSLSQSQDGLVTYESWSGASYKYLRWTEWNIQLFWDMLKSAIWYQTEKSWQEASLEPVSYRLIALFLILHIPDSSGKAASPTAAYDTVWPSRESDILAGTSTNFPPTSPTSPSKGQERRNLAPPPTSPVSPSKGGRPSSPKRSHMIRHSRNPAQNLFFIQSKLHAFICVLGHGVELGEDDDELTIQTSSADFELPRNSVDALSLVIGASIGNVETKRPLSKLHPLWDNKLGLGNDYSISTSQEMRTSRDSLVEMNESETISSASLLDWLEKGLKRKEDTYTGGAGIGGSSFISQACPWEPVDLSVDDSSSQLTCDHPSSEHILIRNPKQPVRQIESVTAGSVMKPLILDSSTSTVFFLRILDGFSGTLSKKVLRDSTDSMMSTLNLEEERTPSPGSLPSLTMSSCCKSSSYVLCPLSYVTITACSDSSITLGAVAGVVLISGCERVRITVACGKLIVRNCLDCSFNLACLCPTTVLGDSRGLIFGKRIALLQHY